MKRSLITRLNLESEGTSLGDAQAVDGTLEVTQEAVIESVVAAQEGEEIVADAIQLESAFVSLSNLTQLAQNLEDAGVDADVVAEQVTPAAIDAIAQVDEELADETENEAIIALESDDKKSVWLRIKEKVKQIWEAIKTNAKKFWVWVKSLFGNLKATGKKLEGAAADLIKRINSAENFTETKIEARSSWSIQNNPADVAKITKSIADIGSGATQGKKGTFASLAEFNEELAGKLSTVTDTAEKIKDIEGKIARFVATGSEDLLKGMTTEGSGFVGYAFKDGKYVSSKIEKGEVSTGSKSELLTLVKAARKAATVIGTLDNGIERVERSVKSIEVQIDKMINAKEVDPEVARSYQTLVTKTGTFNTTVMKIVKNGIGDLSMRSITNGLSFANAALKAATAEKKAA